jgi:hypothetical protein
MIRLPLDFFKIIIIIYFSFKAALGIQQRTSLHAECYIFNPKAANE